jgi:hypothetical protein
MEGRSAECISKPAAFFLASSPVVGNPSVTRPWQVGFLPPGILPDGEPHLTRLNGLEYRQKEPVMKKALLTALLALLAWTASEQRAAAWTKFNLSGGFNLCIESTGRNRCLSYSSIPNPPPCGYSGGPGWDGPAGPDFGGFGGYGGPGDQYPGAPLTGPVPTTTPATPSLPAPSPAPAPMPTGPKQAGYFTATPAAYGYGPGYTIGFGAYQAPSYWYDR